MADEDWCDDPDQIRLHEEADEHGVQACWRCRQDRNGVGIHERRLRKVYQDKFGKWTALCEQHVREFVQAKEREEEEREHGPSDRHFATQEEKDEYWAGVMAGFEPDPSFAQWYDEQKAEWARFEEELKRRPPRDMGEYLRSKLG